MTKYCKCGHKKSEHKIPRGLDTYYIEAGFACNGGIYHHHDLMGNGSMLSMGTELDNCLCPKFRLSNYQKYHAKRWKNTIVYDKTRGIVN